MRNRGVHFMGRVRLNKSLQGPVPVKRAEPVNAMVHIPMQTLPTYPTTRLATMGLLAFCLCVTTAHAQYRFDNWTADNGLPQNSVRDILQTRDGYLWLTTFDGLVRFDGVRFTVFNKSNSPGIISNRFVSLFEDAQGDLWASMENSGLTRLHKGHFTTYTTDDGLPDNKPYGLGGDEQGNLLILSGARPVRWVDERFVPADGLRQPVSQLPSDKAQRLPFHSDGFRLMLYFVNGELHWGDTATLPLLPNGFPLRDRQGNTWFGSAKGLLKITSEKAVKAYPSSEVLPGIRPLLIHGQVPAQALSFTEKGALWITELNSMRSHLLTQQPPKELKIQALYADKEGNYWFGTLLNGLYRARKQSITTYSNAQGLIASEVYPIFEDRERSLWIGTAGNGLIRFKDGTFTTYSGEGSFGGIITSIHQDNAGHLWINGVWRLDGGRFVRGVEEGVLASWNPVWAVCEDRCTT